MFQIDHGYGVAKEALLIFDVKTSHKEHLATKGYLLQDLLHGNNYSLSYGGWFNISFITSDLVISQTSFWIFRKKNNFLVKKKNEFLKKKFEVVEKIWSSWKKIEVFEKNWSLWKKLKFLKKIEVFKIMTILG